MIIKMWNGIKEKLHWKAWYWCIAGAICFLITVPLLNIYIQNKANMEHMQEENALEEVVTRNVQDYLASYVVTDGFAKTLTADKGLQEQLAEKISNNTALLTEEQIKGIVDIALEHYRMLSKMSIDDLTEAQIEALETSIYQNIESLLLQQEDVEVVANGVSAIIEKNLIRQLEKMDASIEELQKEIAMIKSNILGSKDLEDLNLSLADMIENIDVINGHITEVKENLSGEDMKLSQNIDDINSDLDNLHVYCDETATVLIKIRAYMDGINNSAVTSLSKEMEEMYTILETAAAAIEKLNQKVPVLENSIQEIASQTDISRLQKEIERIKSSVNNMSSSISNLKTVVQDNKKKTDELISDLQAEDIAILNKIDTLNKTFTTLQTEAKEAINKLTTQMNTAAKNISTLQTTTESALTDITAIKQEIERLQREKLAVIDVVNVLTADDSSKALSAAMGYLLEQEIQALQGKVDQMEMVINNITNGEVDGSLQAQIDELRITVQECFTYVSKGKKDLASALADKGVTVDAAADFDTFVKGIEQIGIDGTATENKILDGYSAYVENQYIIGEMPEVGNVKVTLKAGETYAVPAGYHAGAGEVAAASMESQTPATAAAAQILANATAWVNGKLLTGTMKNNGAVNTTLGAGDKCTLAGGYYSGGTITAKDLTSQTPGNATAAQLLANATAWVNGKLLTGTMKNNGAANAVLNAGDVCTLAGGYYSGGTVAAKDLASQTPGTATADNISAGLTAWVNGALVTGNGKDNSDSYEQGKKENSTNDLDAVIGNSGIVEAGKKGETGAAPATSIDLSGYGDYQVLSADNLLIYPIEVSGAVFHGGSTDYYVNGCGVSHYEFYKDYNPTTGILTIRPAVGSYKETGQSGDKNLNAICGYYKVKIYLIK